MKKRGYLIVIALLLVVSVSIVALLMNTESEQVKADDFRKGYLIVPDQLSSEGMAITSSFIIETLEETTIKKISEQFFIQDSIDFTISEVNPTKYMVTLAKPLDYDKVYVLGIIKQDMVMVTFAYQTTSKFTIYGYLPNTQSTNVPVNTGIEIYFSSNDINGFEQAFSISPNVKGSFEKHDNAYVFVPKNKLDYQRVYTVTLDESKITSGDGQSLKEQLIFSFETMAKEDEIVEYKYKGNVNFNMLMYEYTTTQELSIPYYLNLPKDNQKIDLLTQVYSFEDGSELVKYMKEVLEKPYWSNYNSANQEIDTSSLKKVTSFNNTITFSYEFGQYFLDIPEKLESGMYLVKMTWKHGETFVFIQITDLAAYVFDDEEKTYIWVNNTQTGNVASAIVNGISTDTDGLAIIPNDQVIDNIVFINDSQNETIIFKNPYYYQTYDNYWNVLTTDRNLYQPDDDVYFFGFISKRNGSLDNDKVTIEINRGYFYYYFDFARSYDYFIPPYMLQESPLVSMETTLTNGFYEGDISLPALSEGYYTITVKYEGEQIANHYFNVEEYVKPSMQIKITPDKKAVFADEPIIFNVNTSFFEGTPVSGLDVTYFIDYEGQHIESIGKSDDDGNVSFTFTPSYINGQQGISHVYVGVRAKLPEQGELVANEYITVYFNDIDYTYKTDIIGDKIILEGKANHFIPDIETGGMIDVGPYADANIQAKLYKHTLVKRENGTYYDYINKETVKQYYYEVIKTLIKSTTLQTNSEGNYVSEFSFNDENRTWYTIELTVNDKKGRKVNKRAYVREAYDYERYYNQNYQLTLDKKKYSVDDTVKATFTYGEDPVDANQYLFIIAQNGIKQTIMTTSHEATFTFIEEYLPNATVQVVAFDDDHFVMSYQQQVIFNKEDRQLNVEITTDKSDYKPGENAIISVKVTDKSGDPISAKVLISAVDEALLELSDMTVDFISELYQSVGSGIVYSYGTHRDGMNIFYDYYYPRGGFGYNEAVMDGVANKMNSSIPIPEPSYEMGGENQSVEIRSEFKDTAAFLTIQTDNNGIGVTSFKMPDNITSWRLFSNAINNDFYAGGNFINVNTTLPFFINVVTSELFLIDDVAYVGVTGYGDALSLFDNITYVAYLKSQPSNKVTVSGKAYERVNIELPQFNYGSDSIIIEAYTNEYSDGLESKIVVTDSYNKIQVTNEYTVSPNMLVSGGSYGNTTLVFADKEYLTYATKLFNLAYYSNERLELLLARDKAKSILYDYLSDPTFDFEKNIIDYSKYQQANGGLSILPYAQSDIKVTVDNLSFMRDDIDENLLLGYLYQQLTEYGSDTYVLYGLAQFNQPILLELQRMAQIKNLTTEQWIYLALAYYEVGDAFMANDIYVNNILPIIVKVEPYAFINEKNDDYTIYLTTKAAYLAKLLNKLEAPDLYKYVTENYQDEYVTSNFLVKFLQLQLEGKKEKDISFTYEYQGNTHDVNFDYGKMHKLEIPSTLLSQFKITKVNGDVGLLVSYEDKRDILVINREDVVTVTKAYLDATTNQPKTTFKMGDIIKVVISIDEGKNFVNTIYEITDILPSGLRAIEKPYQYLGSSYEYSYMRASEQVAKATISKYFIEHQHQITYYARVINLGQYEAMGTYVKLLNSNKVIYQDQSKTIAISE
ncbi:MAG: Ig-like domain-containing protein [Clostridiales bacterium]|nr:Ig-like domain-containing protein [Clostridiales bacterium]